MLAALLGLALAADPAAVPAEVEPPPAPPASAAGPAVFDYKVSLGPYLAYFSNDYGRWFGGHVRAWLLDVTGQRRVSGFVELINLHWRPGSAGNPARVRSIDSYFALARVLRYWNDHVYTFVTLGGTAGDLSFPRFQGELEADFIVPQLRSLVLTFGGGDRYYDRLNRPYLVTGASYSLPKAAVIYRYWYGGGIAREPAHTHLLTLAYGERLNAWWRVDLLWGDASYPGSGNANVLGALVETKGIALNLEKWLWPNLGVIGRVELDEEHIETAAPVTVHRWQVEVRPFVTF
jgi:hypothetical protein